MSDEFVKASGLLLVLLNPMLMSLYVLDLLRDLDARQLTAVLVRAGLIAGAVFSALGLAGEAFFSDVLQTRFASFQIFGGIIFLIVGVQYVFRGEEALRQLRGKPGHLTGAVVMPIMVGPATVSAAIMAGTRLAPGPTVGAIFTAVAASVAGLLALKWLHDVVRPRNEQLVERYVEIAGRASALLIGTFAVDMIARGVQGWWP